MFVTTEKVVENNKIHIFELFEFDVLVFARFFNPVSDYLGSLL